MNYKIIHDEKALDCFIRWLPELEPNEKFYCCLFSRKKYLPAGEHRQSDKAQLKRFTTDKRRMIQKIRQLEVTVGAYQINDEPAPQDSLVLYINPNPRDMTRASYDVISVLSRLLRDGKPGLNPYTEALSCIQQSKGNRVYMDFDIDDHDFDFGRLEGLINTDCCTIVGTRGGFHLLVTMCLIDERYKKNWYNSIKGLPGVDQSGDQLLPVPGCIQGGFVPWITDFMGAPF